MIDRFSLPLAPFEVCPDSCVCWVVDGYPCIVNPLAEVPAPRVGSQAGPGLVPEPSAEPEPEPGWWVPGVTWHDEPVVGPAQLPTVSLALAMLGEIVEYLAGVDPAALPDAQVLIDAEALQASVQGLRVLQLGWTEQVKIRKLHQLRGLRGLGGWLGLYAPDGVAADATLAGRLAEAPVLAEALQDRRVSLSAAAQVGTALSKVARYLDRPDGLVDGQPGEEVVSGIIDNTVQLVCEARGGEAEDSPVLASLVARTQALHAAGGSMHARVQGAFTLLAEHLGAGSALGNALGQQVEAVLPNLLEQQQARAEEHRGLSLTPRPGGAWRVEGDLTPEVGELLFTALAAEARRDPGNPVDTLARQHAREQAVRDAGGDPFRDAPGPETLPRWEQDALRELTGVPDASHPDQVDALTEALDLTTPGAQELAITAAEELALLVPRARSRRLHDALGRLLTRYLAAGLGGVQDKHPVQLTVTLTSPLVEHRPGALPAKSARTGRALARSLLQRWWGDAQVTTLLLSQGWQPLGVAHTGRTSTRNERLALGVQWDHRCAGTDCCPPTPSPLRKLVYHHVRMFSRHGRTSLGETLPICDHLHDDLHLGKHTVRLRDGRLLNEHGFVDEG